MKRRIIATALMVIFLSLVLGVVAGPLLAAQGRGIGAGALPAELKGVKVRNAFIPSTGKAVGVIQTIIGHVVVFREDVKQAYFSAPGDRLYERDSVYTLKASRCRFKLDGEDVVTVGEDTRIGIRSFTENRARGVKNSAFNVVKGKAMFYALKLLRHRESAMTVETPTAVVGVRGTKFGTDVQEITSVHFFEGTGNVVSTITGAGTTIGAGQSISAGALGLSILMPTPPGVGQGFSSDTNVPPPPGGASSGTPGGSSSGGGSAGSGGSNSGGSTGSGTTGGGTGTGTTNIVDTSTITQIQTTTTASSGGVTTPTDSVTDPGPNAANASGSHTGYFASMLTNSTNSSLEEVFVSTSRQDADGNLWLRGSKDTATDYLRVYGGGALSSNPVLKWASFNSGTKKSGDLNLAISHTELGTQPGTDFEWGYWTEPTAFKIDSSYYLVDNRSYYLFGPNATSAEVAAFTGTATYSGKAYGTYWSSSDGVNMTGSFSCNVNFGLSSSQITAFGLSVSGESGANTYSASIASGLATIGSDGCFQITGGEWLLSSTPTGSLTPDKQTAYGSFYSGKDYIGGAWGMYHTSTNTGAAGIFEGAPKPAEWKGEFTAAPRAGVTALNSMEIWTSQSSTDPQNFAVGAVAQTTGNNFTEISANAWTTKVAKMTLVKVGADSSLTVSESISVSEIGHNEYIAWGYWTQPTSISVTIAGTPTDYEFTDKGYYVYGKVTPTMPSGTGTYSGNAYGTLVKTGTTDAAVDLTGTFSMGVNFGSGEISNFNITAQNSTNTVTITQTSGTTASFTGTGYRISGTPLTAKINTDSATSVAVKGNFYGTDASRTGGNWVANTGNASAGGIFVGAKK